MAVRILNPVMTIPAPEAVVSQDLIISRVSAGLIIGKPNLLLIVLPLKMNLAGESGAS